MRLSPRHVVSAVVLCLLCCASVSAETGGLEVFVADGGEGAPLPGATVTLSNEQQLSPPTAMLTGEDGIARFPVLRSGTEYVIEVAMPGFARRRIADLRVSTDQTFRVDVPLSEEFTQTVEVTASRSVVEIDNQEKASRFDQEFLESLPVPGRFYQNMLPLAPGVNDADGDGNPNVHGGRKRNFKAVVGGVSNTDPLTGEWLARINSESIEEIEIITAAAGVEYGRASGGFARVLQKQGSNELEGVASFLYASSELDRDGGGTNSVVEVPDFEWLQPAFHISGPIVKDRMWFRLSHEYIDREQPVAFIDRLDVIQRKQSMNDDQITWQLSPRNKLAFQFQSDPLEIENFGMSSRIPAESSQRLERGGETYKLTWTAPYSSRLLVETQVAYQDHERNSYPQSAGLFNGCVAFGLFGGTFASLDQSGCTNTDTGRVSGSYPETSLDNRQRLSVRSQATYFLGQWLGASHRLKFGFEVENERYYRELERRPDITFFTEMVGLGEIVGTATTRVSVPASSAGRATGTSWALYAEDQLRPANGLSVTLGLRFDREEINSEGQLPFDPQAEAAEFLERIQTEDPVRVAQDVFTAYGNIAEFQRDLAAILGVLPPEVQLGSAAQQSQIWNSRRVADSINMVENNISPRIAVAWDPWANGKTKFAATAGRYYDKIVLAVPLLEIEPPEASLVFTAVPFGDGFLALDRPSGVAPTVSVHMVDRDLETPYQDELSLSFERELWTESSIKLTYVRRKFRDQIQDEDINHVTGDLGRCDRFPSGNYGVVRSPGVGLVRDENDDFYTDTEVGDGDGIIDDCTGDLVPIGGAVLGQFQEVADGLPDLYVQNPGWGKLLLVGNFNTSDYEAYVLELVRRMYRSWQLNASYTWSEAIGDAEDFTQILGNERNLTEDERGFLSYDQRHAVKISAMSITPWGFRLGGSIRWESGLPYSLLISKQTVFATPPQYQNLGDRDVDVRFRYPTRQRNDQRNPDYWTFDVRLAKEFSMPRGVGLQLTAEIFNLLNDDTLRLEDQVNGINGGERRFGRQFQIGLRLGF
ncbi:MAG: TonB-dependent receptor [bacterium]|nr:TonB-dependent receptor [bacterium]